MQLRAALQYFKVTAVQSLLLPSLPPLLSLLLFSVNQYHAGSSLLRCRQNSENLRYYLFPPPKNERKERERERERKQSRKEKK